MFNFLYNITYPFFKQLTTDTNTNIYYLKYIIVFLVIIFIVSIVLFIFVGYFIIKFLKLSVDNNNILFYHYNKKSKKLLDLYGDCQVKKIYLIRQPFSKFVTFLLNICTFYNYEKLISETQDNFPYHTLLLFEIKLDNGLKKLLLLEKTHCIVVSENFLINKSQEIKKLNIKKTTTTLTLNNILNNTQKNIGTQKFFNWNCYKNNCQKFTKEILKTTGNYNKSNKDFIFRDKIFKIIIPSEFTLHMLNCLCTIINIIEKYICDNNIFN
jgi:hypothetical protein